jgi:hypothetical protein
LAHFGIDIGAMSKSEKSMAELTVDAQYVLDAAILEAHGACEQKASLYNALAQSDCCSVEWAAVCWFAQSRQLVLLELGVTGW